MRIPGIVFTRGAATVAVAFLAALALSSEARAQTTGSIIGDVIDGETGANVPGVRVTATSPALQGEVTVLSDDEGRFRVDGLPIGTYALSFAKEGLSAEPITDIQLRAGATLRYDAVVYHEGSALYGVGGAATGVVRVTAPVVDVGSTQSGGTLNADITRRVPLAAPGGKGGAQRSFESAATVMPQVQADNFGASVNGATSVENNYVIDGISVNNQAYGYLGAPLSLEFIEEMSVITGGYMPEYGRSMGGLLNVVTKSGGNEFKGSFFTNIAPGFLEGDRAQIGNEGSAIRIDPELNYVGDVGFELGGPILKDELWFYVGADIARQSFRIGRELFRANDTFIEGSRDEFFAESTSMQALAKLTWLATADNRLTFTVLATPSISGGPGKLGIDQRTGKPEVFNSFDGSYEALAHIYQAGAIDGQVRWQLALLERKLRLDTSVGYHHEVSNLGGTPSDGSTIGSGQGLSAVPRVFFRRSIPGNYSIADFETLPSDAGCDAPGTAAAELCPVTTYQFGGPDFIDEQTSGSLQLRHVTSYVMEALGLHVFKAGAEVGYGTFNNTRAYSGGRRYRDNATGTLFTDNRQFGFLTGPDEAVVLEKLQWETHDFNIAAFLQDSWTMFDIVTLNLGLRYDGEWLFAGDGSNSLALPNQISPRAGVIVDPFKSGRVKLFGAFARYYEAVPLDIADRAGSSEPQITSGRPAAVCDPRDPKQNAPDGPCLADENLVPLNEFNSPNQKWVVTGGGRTAVDPNIQPPSSDEITVGAEAEVFRDARVALSYTRRWIGCPWTGAEDIGDGMLCTRAIEDMSRDEANTYFIGNPGFGIARDFPIAQRTYDALTLLFHKQWSEGWLAQASYTLSLLEGNYAGLFRPETEQLDPNINSDFDLVSLTQNRFGPLPFDRTHQLKGYAAKEFEAAYGTRFTVGVAGQASSGAPTNFLGSHPLYGADEVFILPRGSGERLPWLFSTDLHAGFAFAPFGEQTIEVTVDVFNMFNFQSAVLVDETYTEADVNPLQFCDGERAQSCTADDLAALKNTDNTDFDPLAKNPNFGQPKEFQAPRTVRFGVRWSF